MDTGKFEQFRKSHAHSLSAASESVTASVMVSTRRTMTLNRAAMHLLGEPDYVNLFYSQKARQIGIEATTESEDAFKVHPDGATRDRGRIMCKSFISYYAIPHEQSRRYPAIMRSRMLVITLPQSEEASRKDKASTNPKLTQEQVQEIRQRYSAGDVTYADLASAYGVSRTMIYLIVSGRAWRTADSE